MAGHPAAFGQNGAGGMHPANILGAGFAAHQNAGFIARRAGLRGFRGKHDLSSRGAGAGRHPLTQHIARCIRIHLAVQ